MPTSALAVVPAVIDHMAQLQPSSILDVGPGYGKYGVLFREYLESHPRMWAVEAWEPYVTNFGLRGIYDRVIVADVMTVDVATVNACEAVYLGDVIEHLTKEDGVALLQRIVRPVVVNTPAHFFRNPDGLPWTETHRSHWTLADFEATGRMTRGDIVEAGLVVTLAGA